MKTARFAEVVKACGAPQVHQLWVAADQDPGFARAIKDHRVVTVHQENVGTKKDSGSVGFRAEPTAQYLVFPRSVQRFAGRRIIGIDYDLLAASERVSASPAAKASATKPATSRRIGPSPKGARATGSKPASASNVVAFTAPRTHAVENKAAGAVPPTPLPRKITAAPKPVATAAALEAKTRAEIRRAMAELKAGKAVAACERLGRLVSGSPAMDGSRG